MSSNKIHFRSFEELEDSSLTEKLSAKEFAEEIPVEDFIGDEELMNSSNSSRRDFLKLLGFSSAAVTLAACEAPIVKSIPYIIKPGNITPGIPTYYASAFFNGSDFSNVLVKTREGRPIKIDSNKKNSFLGVTNARTQASVLSLYDAEKIPNPKIKGKNASWKEVDTYVKSELEKVVASGKKIILLTSSLASPSTKIIVDKFGQKTPNFEHVIYDVDASSLDASEEVYGKRVTPFYDLSSTELVVSFGSDFLNDSSKIGIEVSYTTAKKPTKNMLRHIQVESNLSMTGASADERIPLKPSRVAKLLVEVYKSLKGGSQDKIANKIAKELVAKGNKAVVFADGNKDSIKLAYLINAILGSSAVTQKAVMLKESNTSIFNQFLNDLNSDRIGAVLFYQANPVYNHPQGEKIKTALNKVELLVSLSQREDETTNSSKNFILAPTPSWLESWGEITPISGAYSFQQPTIQKIFDTRQLQDSLLVWSSQAESTYYNFLKETYASKLGISFDQALYNGYNELSEAVSFSVDSSKAQEAIDSILAIQDGSFELELYSNNSIGDGIESNNPWLQELPDPISRISWDNYLSISKADAVRLGLNNDLNGRMQLDGDKVNIKINGTVLEGVPIFIQPGQAVGSLGLALGYGRKNGGKVCNDVGVNAYSLMNNGEKHQYNVTIEKAEGTHEFASVQLQNTLMGRYEIAREATLNEVLNKETKEWNPATEMHTHKGIQSVNKVDLWTTHDDTFGPKFNLSIDLNSCTGCAACIVACQAENNVPVVGKEEIRKSRDMFWLRIDRYYSTELPKGVDLDNDGEWSQTEAFLDDYNEPEQYNDWLIHPAAINPKVIFQPVMCQHCNHAPCETVCPVAATSHGRQGQNQMTYNRCVGTRYCANNCPYKVRRFNWFNYGKNDKFDYHMNSDLGRMVLNPDVVVRSRGVMEKCSMCIQITQSIISKAKKEGRRIRDEELQTACSSACSTGSIQFGDINDSSTKITELSKDNRKFILLEEVGAKPNVFYHVKVRNENKV